MSTFPKEGRRCGVALAIAVLLAAGACSDERERETATGGAPVSGVEPDPLVLEIQSVTLPPGDAVRPVVRFRVTDPAGNPIDVAAELANLGATPRAFPNVRPRFTLAQVDDEGNYTSYYTSTETASTTFTPPPGPPPTPTPTPATQATSQTATVAGLAAVGNGVYDVTLGPTNVPGLDRSRTHTVAGWIERARTSLDSDVAHHSFNFVPTGGAPQLDQVVSDNACNRCHGVLQAHGTRRGTQLCITCHSPQTTDAETSRTVDFKVMVHKIHFGANLPSVQQGRNYYIVGFNESVHDYSEVAFPWHDGVQHCSVCHQGEDANNWQSKASFAACTSCHDNVQFPAAAPAPGTLPFCNTPNRTPAFADCVHSGNQNAQGQFIAIENPQTNVAACRTCHGGASSLSPVAQFHHGD